jgi:hypothetical protein
MLVCSFRQVAVPTVGCDVISSFTVSVFGYALPPAVADNDAMFGARIFLFFMGKIAAVILSPSTTLHRV